MKPWGTATVTTKGDYQGANRVLVFRTSDGKLVADGVTCLMGYEDDGTTPIMKAETPRLKAVLTPSLPLTRRATTSKRRAIPRLAA